MEEDILNLTILIEEAKKTPDMYNKYIKLIENLIKERQLDKERIKELEGKYNYEKNRARIELDTVYIKARYDERAKWQSLIKEKIEELNKPTEIEKKYHWYKDIRLGKIQILEELLGEEK